MAKANRQASRSTAPHKGDDVMTLYRKLADGLSDMVEGSRLSEADIPDDYQWLVETLAAIAGADPCKEGEVPYEPTRYFNADGVVVEEL